MDTRLEMQWTFDAYNFFSISLQAEFALFPRRIRDEAENAMKKNWEKFAWTLRCNGDARSVRNGLEWNEL